MNNKFLSGLKYLLQFGLRPLALYALYKFGLFTGHYKRLTPVTPLSDEDTEENSQKNLTLAIPWLEKISTLLFSLPPREQLSQTLGEAGKTVLLKAADEIVDGSVRIFGESVSLQFAFDRPLSHWTDYENHKIQTPNYQLPATDIKFLWEPARFGWAFTLGRAYHLTQDKKYAEAFWKYFEAFTQANPANLGPHWMNGQEVAIRLMSLVWCAHVFAELPITNYQSLITSIHRHASRIPPTLPYARSQNNNHLVTEAAALYTAGLFLDNPNWRNLGWKWLNWSFQNQIGGYGEYIQHSTNYHRVMLQTALWINLIKREAFPTKTSQAIGRSAHWLFSLLDNISGLTPNLGANDGALIFPLSSSAFADYRPTVQAAARAFLRTGLPAGIWDEMSLWFGLKPADRIADSSAYLTDNLRGQNSWAYLRASHFKSRLSHMDQLNLDLWWRGLNITQDAGTYLYNADPPWDNPLMTTRVHNTVTVDGRDQMTRAGRFLVLDWANAYSKNLIETDENILGRIRAHHHGYGNVKHERTVTVYQDERWLIEDTLRVTSPRRRPHTYRLHWLLPDWEYQLEETESAVRLRLNSPYGWITLSIQHTSRITHHTLSLVRAGELLHGQRDVLPYEGWVSHHYGQKSPALSLALEVTSEFNVTFTTEFTFPQ